MKLYEILIPTLNKQGISFDQEVVADVMKQIATLVGGVSLYHTHVHGLYIGKSGNMDSDYLTPIRVACEVEQLVDVCEIVAKAFDQESVFAYEVSGQVYILQNVREEA